MLRLRRLHLFSLRCGLFRTMSSDPLLDEIRNCATEDHVFDLIGKNKAKLSVKHVGCAMSTLWRFQKEKPKLLRNVGQIRSHPEFLTLRILAENKIDFMDDDALVDMLYSVLRFQVVAHDSLVQQLVIEGSQRIQRFNPSALSKFALCLSEQHMYNSPLMGKIADVASSSLDSLMDARALTNLMISLSAVISQQFRDKLIEKAESLMATVDLLDPVRLNDPRRIVQFLRNVKYTYRPLLDKCNAIFIRNISQLDVENISILLGLYQSLQFSNFEFRMLAKQRLTDMMDICTDLVSFIKLFAALAPMAGPEVREKIAVVLLKHLDSYRPIELARITQSLVLLHCQNPELYTHLRKALTRYLRVSCVPSDVSMLVRVLSMLPSSRVDEAVISNVHAVLPQSSLSDLNSVATAIIKWVRNHHPLRHSTIGEYGKLLQQLNSCAHDRVKKMDNIDLLLEELKYVSGDWLEEILLKETLVTFQRLIDQISWTNVVDISLFLTRTNCLCIPLLDRMASVTLQHIDKIHYSAMYAILLTFSVLNYEPPQGDEFFETCIQHFTPYLSSFDPHLLVLLGYSLAVAEYFPEALTKEIFNIEFLAKLDAQLETMPASLNMKIRLRLMELNRAICLECPEFQIPWFHDRFCQQQLHQGNGSLSALQHQVHHLLGELLGGVHYARVAVMTPYYYTIDFECILDKHRKPLPYANRNMLLSDLVKMNWGPDSRSVDKKDLAPDAQRVALEFLDSKAFCKNSTNLKGEYIMKKRHLEILGYHVVQIPLFEWNSMELSTKDAWMEYLRKNIFAEDINS
ncbi:FAST kinase domain-containing protein 1, mitochondrial isoform X2 [Ambystoma mexicanum]|uniref:FAST kinase domain-containing protein 1, mitochondrial isoform X2 n=1 Tax=Ambystoma mexicanum TaxID=8296 RepID=UPI0037E96449